MSRKTTVNCISSYCTYKLQNAHLKICTHTNIHVHAKMCTPPMPMTKHKHLKQTQYFNCA